MIVFKNNALYYCYLRLWCEFVLLSSSQLVASQHCLVAQTLPQAPGSANSSR